MTWQYINCIVPGTVVADTIHTVAKCYVQVETLQPIISYKVWVKQY